MTRNAKVTEAVRAFLRTYGFAVSRRSIWTPTGMPVTGDIRHCLVWSIEGAVANREALATAPYEDIDFYASVLLSCECQAEAYIRALP